MTCFHRTLAPLDALELSPTHTLKPFLIGTACDYDVSSGPTELGGKVSERKSAGSLGELRPRISISGQAKKTHRHTAKRSWNDDSPVAAISAHTRSSRKRDWTRRMAMGTGITLADDKQGVGNVCPISLLLVLFLRQVTTP